MNSHKGHVKWFSRLRRYGFITCPDFPGRDIFVHGSEISRRGDDNLYEGERVVFGVEDNVINGRYRGLKAVAVQVL